MARGCGTEGNSQRSRVCSGLCVQALIRFQNLERKVSDGEQPHTALPWPGGVSALPRHRRGKNRPDPARHGPDQVSGAMTTERLPGAAALVVGLAFCILARGLPAQTGFGLGPAFLPFWMGVLLSLCGAWVTIRPGKQSEGEAAAPGGPRRAAFGLFI